MFYQKHKKIILTLLITVLVGGGVLGIRNFCFARLSDQELTNIANNIPDIKDGTYIQTSWAAPGQPASSDGKSYWIFTGPGENNFIYINVDDGTYSDVAQGTGGNLVDKSGKVIQDYTPKGQQSALSDIIARMVAWILYALAYGLGLILMLFTRVMFIVATFNNFTKHAVVTTGWTVIRDVCNNFFIILLLVSAVGTILHQKQFDFRALMPKILIAAVLINFSKMFFGLLIDASQVLMLTFAAPLASSDGYNIVLKSMGLPSLFSFSGVAGDFKAAGINTWSLVAAMLFAVIFTFVALVVITCMTVVLFYRIVYLLFLVVLSPLFFFGTAFPAIGKHTGQIWSDLVKYLIVGPAMMFFVFISLTALQNLNPLEQNDDFKAGQAAESATNVGKDQTRMQELNQNQAKDELAKVNPQLVSISNMGTVDGVINFGLLIGLLVCSLVIGQKLGGAGASAAGKGLSNLQRWGKQATIGAATTIGKGAARRAGQAAGTGALAATGFALRGIGRIGAPPGGQAPGAIRQGLGKLGDFTGAWREDVLKSRQDAKAKKRTALFKKLGMGEKAQTAWGEFAETDLGKGLKTAATGAGALLGGAAAAAIATAVTGGLAAPILAGLAASYVSGGGRLAEIGMGKWGKSRKEAREAEEARIKEQKDKTDEIVRVSEADRDKQRDAALAPERQKRDTEINTLNSTQEGIDGLDAQRNMKAVENAKINNKNKFTGKGLSQEIRRALTAKGWSGPGEEITQAMLDQAKTDIKNGPKWQDWKNKSAVYDAKLQPINQAYEAAAEPIEDRAEQWHLAQVENKLGSNSDEWKRWKGEYDANKTLQRKEQWERAALDSANQETDRRLNVASNDPDKIDAFEADRRKKEAQANYDREISAARDVRNKAVEAVQPIKPKETITDRFLSEYAPYAHPNWVTMKAVETASKDTNKAKGQIRDIEGGENFWDSNQGSFRGSGGQNEAQKKFFALLGKSDAAMKQLTDSISNMPDTLNTGQQKMILEFKKGLGEFKANGGDVSQFSTLINLLNNAKLDKVDANKNGTVEEFEEKYKPKK